MPFPLLRLPFLAMKEVLKSMDVGELFVLPPISKKCLKVVKASISAKSSLVVSFTPTKDELVFRISSTSPRAVNFSPELPETVYRIKNMLLTVQFSLCGRGVECRRARFGDADQDEKFIEVMIKYFMNSFNLSFELKFDESIREVFAMDLIRSCKQTKSQLPRIEFHYKNGNPEYIRELLREYAGEDSCLTIDTNLPEDFEYFPPPGGFKLRSFRASNAHWVKLEDFLNCQTMNLSSGFPKVSPQYLNQLFKKIINMEYSIESLVIRSTEFNESEFPEMVAGLSNSPIDGRCKKVHRKDGRRMGISLFQDRISFY